MGSNSIKSKFKSQLFAKVQVGHTEFYSEWAVLEAP